MFEKLLQKILKDVIGQFTEQIDTNNLSVGIWSGEIQINKVKLSKNLFKKFGIPITVVFSYIAELKIKIPWKSFFSSPLVISIDSAFALCQTDSIQMSSEDQKNMFINSLKLLISSIGKKVIERSQSQKQNQSGYFQTIFMKMFDNLYLSIKNVHFRFQDLSKKFCFGLCLQSLDIYAVDEKGKQIFVDRTKIKDNQILIRRKFNMRKLKFYWQPSQSNFLCEKGVKQKSQFFLQQRKFQSNSKMSMMNIFYIDLQGLVTENNTGKNPYYFIQINQQKIEINFKRQIIDQFLYFMDKIQQKSDNKKRQNMKTNSPNAYKFLKLFCQQYLNDNKVNQKLRDSKIDGIIKSNNQEILQLIDLNFQQLQKIIEKIILNDIGKEKLFQTLGLKQSQIKSLINQNLIQKQKTLKIQLLFKIPKVLIYLFSQQNKPLLQLNLSNSEMRCQIQDSKTLINFSISIIQILGHENSQIFKIKQMQKNSLKISIKTVLNKSQIQVILGKVNILYDPKVINLIVQFFTFTSFNTKLKNKALDKLQNIQNNVSKKIKQSKNQINLKVWVSGLSATFLHKQHQLNLQSGQIQFVQKSSQSVSVLVTKDIELNLLKNNNQKGECRIIQPFTLNLKYDFKAKVLSTKLSEINLSLDQDIYLFGFQFAKIFSGQQKKEMLKKTQIIGQIFVKQNRWKKTLSVIHNGIIFLWNQNQQYPKLKMRIRKAKEVTKGKFTYMVIGDKKDQIQIAFKTLKQYNIWKTELQKTVQFGIKSQRKSSINQINQTNQTNQIKNKESETKLILNLMMLNIQIKTKAYKPIELKLQELVYRNDVREENEQFLSGSQISIKNFKVECGEQEIFRNKNQNQKSFIICKFKTFGQHNQTVSVTQTQIQQFVLNFDPVLVISLNSFLSKRQDKNQHMYVLKSQQILDKQDQSKVLSRFVINMEHSQIFFKNKKTKLNIASFSFQKLKVQILTKYYESQINGISQGLVVNDLSGYPNTVYEQSKQKQNSPANQILCQGSYKNRIQFKYLCIQKGSTKYDQRKKNLLKVSLHGFKLNFMYQVFFRVVDYLLVQLIGSISSPQFFEEFYAEQTEVVIQGTLDFKNFIKTKDQLMRSKALANQDRQQLQQFIFNGIPFHLELSFYDSTIILISENIKQGLYFDIKEIFVENQIRFVDKKMDQLSYRLVTQFYEIQMKEIVLSMVQKSKKTVVNEDPLSLKISIQMFNKDLQYNYLYGQKDIFTSNMNINVDIEPCTLNLQTQNFTTIQKVLVYNIWHNDGLQFLMIYDYMDLMPQMKVYFKLTSDSFSVQIIQQEQKVLIDTGNLNLLFQKTKRAQQLKIQCQYIVFNYAFKDQYEQVLTSRKNFGRFQPRKTLLRSYLSSASVQKQDKQSIFILQIKQDHTKKVKQTLLSIEEVMIIFNQKLVLMLKRISAKKQALIPFQKVYKDKDMKTLTNVTGQKITKILANKIIFCCKFPQSNDMILALLFTCQYKQNDHQRNLVFPHLQGFVSNHTQISNQNINSMKKRTILRPTQLKYSQNEQIRHFFLERVFFKISVNDLKQLVKLQRDFQQKLSQLSQKQERSSTIKRNIKSVSNQSVHNNSKLSAEKLQLDQADAKPTMVSFGTFQVMIINDVEQNIIPLVYGNMSFQWQYLTRTLKWQVKLDFFNIRNSYWEPFIEKTNILVGFKPHLNLRTEKKQFININVSTNLIENFYKTIHHRQINVMRLLDAQQQIGVDQINSWVILNQIGQDIICRSTDLAHQVMIPYKQSAKINFLTNYQENFVQNKVQEREIFVNIVIGEKLQIKQLNINQLGLKRILFTYNSRKCMILKNLVVDISKNVRYLTFSSTLQIQNKTDLSLRFYNKVESKYLGALPKSTKFLPFNICVDSIFLEDIFQGEPMQQLPLPQTEQDTANNKQRMTLQTIQSQDVIHYNQMSFKVKSRFQKMKKVISFQPIYLIKNYLPQQLTIVVRDKNKHSLLNQYIIQGINQFNRENLTPIYHEINQTEISFWVQGYQWTDFQEFQAKKKIVLKDYSNHSLEIKIHRLDEPQKTSQIIFYYPLILKNKTISPIKVHTKNHRKSLVSQLKKDQSQILISRDVVFQVGEGFSEQIYLKNYTEFFTFSQKLNNLKSFSKYFVYKNTDKISEGLVITELRIYNKYLINNSTQFDILLRPFPAKTGQVQIVEKGQKIDLLFFQIQSQLSVGSMFQFCPRDNQFQWSHPLNLPMVKQSTFFIRSRFQFNKMKHFILQVTKKLQSCFQISFKQIYNQDCIPFMLVNQCTDRQIYIKNTLQNIQPNHSIHFNWDDPFQNSTNIFLQIKGQHKLKIPYTLNINKKQSTLISSKHFDKSIQVQIIIEPNRKKIIFKDQDQVVMQKQVQVKNVQIDMPIRISLINNSISPVVHVFDISTHLKYQAFQIGQRNVLKTQLNSIQIDNQANYNPLYPVIFSTSMNLIFQNQKNKSLQIKTEQINLKIEEDLFKSILSLKSFFQTLLEYEAEEGSKQVMEKKSQRGIFISKLILPKITINLEVQTRNFSLETTVNLEKPQVSSFPWKEFPYPVKKIVLNVLSHLSISPWAFLTSFKKGIQILLTQQSTGRAFQGFFGTILGAVSNSLSGVLGFIVGYDVERVDNLIDGLDQGVSILLRQFRQIPEFQNVSCNLGSILQGTGKTLVNVVFKPIKGILRMTLKISQGIKKTAQFTFQQPNSVKTRLPIVFYNRQQYFTPYHEQESKNLQILRQTTGNKLEYFYLLRFFKMQLYIDKIQLLLAIGTEYIVLLNLTKRKVKWIIQVPKIKSMEIVDICKIMIHVSDQFEITNRKSPSRKDMSSVLNRPIQYGLFMINQSQAIQVVETYMKIKKYSKIQF